MNWVDIVLLMLLVAAVIVGTKKGMIRELMALVVLVAALVLVFNYVDIIATKVYEQLGGSPLVTAIISFIIFLGIIYAFFRLLSMLFYKFANLQKLGKRDQFGGALIGAIRGWLIISFLVFLVFLFPVPETFYADFEASFLGPTFARTLPLVYETTAGLHPDNPDFMQKVEKTLIQRPGGGMSDEDKESLTQSREEIYRVIYQIDRFFGPGQ